MARGERGAYRRSLYLLRDGWTGLCRGREGVRCSHRCTLCDIPRLVHVLHIVRIGVVSERLNSTPNDRCGDGQVACSLLSEGAAAVSES